MMKVKPGLGRVPLSNIIGVFFGGLWAAAGSVVFFGLVRGVLLALSIVITAGLALRLSRRAAAGNARSKMFRRRPYIVAVLLEAVAIAVAIALLPRYGAERYLPQAIGVIVGLHFIGLWRASGSYRFVLLSAGMCVLSAVSMLARSAVTGDALTGFGNALILWWSGSSSD